MCVQLEGPRTEKHKPMKYLVQLIMEAAGQEVENDMLAFYMLAFKLYEGEQF